MQDLQKLGQMMAEVFAKVKDEAATGLCSTGENNCRVVYVSDATGAYPAEAAYLEFNVDEEMNSVAKP